MEQFEQITCISLKSFRFLFFFLWEIPFINHIHHLVKFIMKVYFKVKIYKYINWVGCKITFLEFRSTGQVCDFLFFFQYFHNIASRQGKLSVWNQFLSKCILHVLISLRCAFYDCYVLLNSLSVCEGAKTCFLFHYSNLIILNRSIMTSMIMCNWYWQI